MAETPLIMLIMRRTVAMVLAVLLCYAVPAVGQGYDPETEEVFQAVARLMGIRIREEIPRPRILFGPEVDPEAFARHVGFDTGGRIFSAYFPGPNLIVLDRRERATLAHELVHYFQVVYWGMIENDSRDTLERQATAVEQHFRDAERVRDGPRDSAR
jgi:hypothetical protein